MVRSALGRRLGVGLDLGLDLAALGLLLLQDLVPAVLVGPFGPARLLAATGLRGGRALGGLVPGAGRGGRSASEPLQAVTRTHRLELVHPLLDGVHLLLQRVAL